MEPSSAHIFRWASLARRLRATHGEAPEVDAMIAPTRVNGSFPKSLPWGADQRGPSIFLKGIQTLAHALEAKDEYTWGHSARVSAYAMAIARELGLPAEEMAAVSLGGELHDMGKIGVREEVLHKAGPLSPEEYLHLMEHTVIGTRILYPLLQDYPVVLNIVRSHHERVDGTGLPDGLAGTAIPLDARIVAVADAFDAMTSPRPYRPPLPIAAALRELEDNAGSQFDGDCVRALRAVIARRPLGRRPLEAEAWPEERPEEPATAALYVSVVCSG